MSGHSLLRLPRHLRQALTLRQSPFHLQFVFVVAAQDPALPIPRERTVGERRPRRVCSDDPRRLSERCEIARQIRQSFDRFCKPPLQLCASP